MTREEAHISTSSQYSSHLKRAINKIYDDFESRTCENCKYLTEHNDCLNIDSMIETPEGQYIFSPSSNFGCNKFERKQDG